jgi:hypothetical protein
MQMKRPEVAKMQGCIPDKNVRKRFEHIIKLIGSIITLCSQLQLIFHQVVIRTSPGNQLFMIAAFNQQPFIQH